MLIKFAKVKRRYLILAVSFTLAWIHFFSISHIDPEPAQNNLPRELSEFEDSPTRPKIFVIGLSKTGTTSVGDALSLLSFARLGWEDLRSRFLFRSYLKGKLHPFISLTHHYDAFEDLPWGLVYTDMARLYPDSRFILTLRGNEEDWLRSVTEHTARRKWIGHDFVYGAAEAEGNEEMYLQAYRNHTTCVREFFAMEENGNGTRLLELVIDAGHSGTVESSGAVWGMLLRFLGIGDSDEVREKLGEFPWNNRTDTWRHQWVLMRVRRWWDKFIGLLEYVAFVMLGYLGWLTASMG